MEVHDRSHVPWMFPMGLRMPALHPKRSAERALTLPRSLGIPRQDRQRKPSEDVQILVLSQLFRRVAP